MEQAREKTEWHETVEQHRYETEQTKANLNEAKGNNTQQNRAKWSRTKKWT